MKSSTSTAAGNAAPSMRYDSATRVLHWAMALLVAALYLSNQWRHTAPKGSDARIWWLSMHESIGLAVLLLAVVRLAWRRRAGGGAHRGAAARIGHGLLYLALLALPLAGILRATGGGKALTAFGMRLSLFGGKTGWAVFLGKALHETTLMNLLLVLIAGHIAIALYRGLILRDGTLRRML